MKKIQKASHPNLFLALLICGIACSFFLLESIIANSFDTFSATIRQQFALNNYHYASLSSIYLLANLVCLLPLGLALDRLPIKYVISGTLSISIMASLVITIATNYATLFFGFLFIGIGGSVAFLACITLIKHWMPQPYISLANGIVVGSAMFGGIIAQSPLLLFLHYARWQQFYFLIAIIEVFLLLATLMFVKERTDMAQQPYTMKRLLTLCAGNKYNWLGGGYTSIMNLSVTLIGALFGQGLLVSLYHVSPLMASEITSLLFVGILIGSPLIGWLNNRVIQQKTLMLVGAIAAAIILLLLLLSPIKTPLMASFYFLLLGLSSSTQVLGYTLVSDSNDTRTIGTAISMAGMIVMFGGAFFQPLLGWLLDSLHGNYQWVLGGVVVLFCLAFGMVFWIYCGEGLKGRDMA